MAIIENKQISGSGFKKTIDEDSMEMILDMTQVSQYQKPHHSAVRETVSNAVDSVIERNLSKNIITGKEKLEDHYDTSKTEGQYKGSSFDEDYYDLNFFSTEKRVFIEYYEKANDKDYIKITDYGVGLGGKRLEKSFNPGYSSKRTSKDTLGSFGIGAKSPLATGAEYYIMTSNHNGRMYKFKIYVNKVDCLIPKFSKGKMNNSHVFENKYHAYYEETTNKNSVIIEWEVKKHNRDIINEAVTSQLMYFDNVIYRRHNDLYGGSSTEVNIKADILYSDDEIMVPKVINKHISKPHILLGKEGKYVNYGTIDFDELELPHYEGGIGFKMDPSDVSISPSRENLVWNEKTKAAILDKFEVVKALVNEELKDQLKETDFVKWNIVAESISSNLNRASYGGGYGYGYSFNDQEDLVSVLSKLLTTGDGVALKYSDDYSYTSLNSAFDIKDENIRTAMRDIRVNDTDKYRLNRQPVYNWRALSGYDIYVTEDDKADRIKDIHICKNLDERFTKGFVLIHKNKVEDDDASKLLFSSSSLKEYDTFEVPEEDRLIYQNKINQADMTPAERRRLDKKVVAKQYKKGYGNVYTDKVEFKIGDMINDFNSDSIVYGHRDDDKYLRFAAEMLGDTTVKVLLVSQGNLKHFKAYGSYVNDFLIEGDSATKTVKVNECILDNIRNNYVRKVNPAYDKSYIEELKNILPNEFKVYDYLYNLPSDNRNMRSSYFNQIANALEQENTLNIKLDEYISYNYETSNFDLLQNYLDLGYTIDSHIIKEKEIIDKFSKLIGPIDAFLSSISCPDSFEKEIDKYLSAVNYIKLPNDHGWL